MGCRKGKSTAKPKAGHYECADCGAVVKKKKDVCDPQKVGPKNKPKK
jgi:transcription initiation factor TFIIIB Brf1 subunit/transcription initiation factor TFIIB